MMITKLILNVTSIGRSRPDVENICVGRVSGETLFGDVAQPSHPTVFSSILQTTPDRLTFDTARTQ